jgi:hypothetical protein
MKENIINLNKAMPKNKSDKQSITSRLIEFIIYVMSAAVIMYYLFKIVFGSPGQLKENNETIGAINSKIDSIYALQDLTQQGITNLKDDQIELKNMINNNQIMIKENNEEISALKKVVNQKINMANQTINTQNRRIVELEQKSYNSLDSFFRA